MSFTSKVGQMFNTATSGTLNPANWLVEAFGGGNKSSAGIAINWRSVMSIPTVYNAVSKISGHLAVMPLECKETKNNEVNTFLADAGARVWARPHEFVTKFTLVEKLMVDALLYGNARAYIERNSQGQPVGLIPLQAENCTTVIHDGERWHYVTVDDASLMNGEAMGDGSYKIPDRDVFYIMGVTRNGLWGESMIDIMRDQFGLSIAGAEATGSMFRNAGRPGLLLEAPRGAFRTAKEAQTFLDQFNEAHEGVSKSGKTGMVREGMTAKVLPADGNGASYKDSRLFQRESMAIAFLLETILGDNTGASYKSVTERQSAYITNCLGRWISKFEHEADMKLLSQRQKNSYNFRYVLDANILHANNTEFLANYTANLRQQGVMSMNEARKIHGLNPVEGGDDDYGPTSSLTPVTESVEVVDTEENEADTLGLPAEDQTQPKEEN